ncbi:hypothetical protein F5Y06DRAFT_299447 [Hypoxylon sp. FL0890]|nr:hypothetical protein F5Y06DRAFT_299447 [Hypoxylon sp. FL0890]
MYRVRRVFEPILTIIDPVSSPVVARGILKDLALVLLTLNAVASFTLIMTVIAVAQYTSTIKAFCITYIVVLVVTLILASILHVRRVYFESHPLRSPPAGYVRPNTEDDDRGKHGESTDADSLNNLERTSSLEHMQLGDIEAQRPQAAHPSSQVHLNSRYSQNPYRRVAETSSEYPECDNSVIAKTDGALSKIAKGVIANHHYKPGEFSSTDSASDQRIRFPFEQPETEPTSHGNHVNGQEQGTLVSPQQKAQPQQETRQYPKHSAGSTNHQKSVRFAL